LLGSLVKAKTGPTVRAIWLEHTSAITLKKSYIIPAPKFLLIMFLISIIGVHHVNDGATA